MKHYLISWFVTGLLLLISQGAVAAELTLEQAQQLALEHAHALRAARAGQQASESALNAARSERWPTLSISAAAYLVDDIPTISLGIPGGPSIERQLGTEENYKTDIRLALPVFTGGRIAGGISLAESEVKLREALVRAERDQVLLSTRVEFLRLHQAKQVVNSATASLERARVIQRDIQALYDAGAADSTDLLEVELAVTSAKMAVDQAASNRTGQRIRLNLLLGRDAYETLSPVVDLPRPDTALPPTRVLASKPQLRAAEAAIALSEHQVTLARSDWWPTLSVYGGYTFGEPNRDMFNAEFDDYFSLGANLSWSFNLRGKTSSRVSRAHALVEAARADYSHTERTLNREAHLAREQVLLAFERYTSADRRYKITSANYRLARTKHREGGLSSNRLLEIEESLSAAEAESAAAKTEVFIATSFYLYAIGSEDLGKGL